METEDVIKLVDKIEYLWDDFLESDCQKMERLAEIIDILPTLEEFSKIEFDVLEHDSLHKRVCWCRELAVYIDRHDFGIDEYRKDQLLSKINSVGIKSKWQYSCENYYNNRNRDGREEYYSTIHDIYKDIWEYEFDIIYYSSLFKDDEAILLLNKICKIYHEEIEPIEDVIFQRKEKLQDNSLELSERAKKYFERALMNGFMEKVGNRYIWIWEGKARLAYFIHSTFNPNGTERIPYKKLEALFGISRLERAVDQVMNAKNPQKWREEIDNKVFYD